MIGTMRRAVGRRLLGAGPGRVVAVTSPQFADPAAVQAFLAWLAWCPPAPGHPAPPAVRHLAAVE